LYLNNFLAEELWDICYGIELLCAMWEKINHKISRRRGREKYCADCKKNFFGNPAGCVLAAMINEYKQVLLLHHKDYARGIPIQISVYDDKLYIANCGRLPENWSAQKLMEKHSSEPYNPNIAHVYYLAGFIESWGRGIEKICDACREDDVPLPEYDITGNTVMIKFMASEDRIIRFDSEKVTEKEQEILSLLLENPYYTYVELAAKLQVSRKTVAVRIALLKRRGIRTATVFRLT